MSANRDTNKNVDRETITQTSKDSVEKEAKEKDLAAKFLKIIDNKKTTSAPVDDDKKIVEKKKKDTEKTESHASSSTSIIVIVIVIVIIIVIIVFVYYKYWGKGSLRPGASVRG